MKSTLVCVHCDQEIHRLDRPWNTRHGFTGEYANRFGLPWCPFSRGSESTDLVPHAPKVDSP